MDPISNTTNKPGNRTPAGFWIRLVAYIIDSVLLMVVSFVLAMVVGFPLGEMFTNPDFQMPAGYMMFVIGALVVQTLYHAFLESSAMQATHREENL